MLLHNHLDMIGRNEPIQRKAKFWQSYVRALKGTDDMRAPEAPYYSRYPFRSGIFRPLYSDVPTWPNLKSIYDDPIHAADRITVPGYRYLPISRETYGLSPRNIYPHHYSSLDRYPRHGDKDYATRVRGEFKHDDHSYFECEHMKTFSDWDPHEGRLEAMKYLPPENFANHYHPRRRFAREYTPGPDGKKIAYTYTGLPIYSRGGYTKRPLSELLEPSTWIPVSRLTRDPWWWHYPSLKPFTAPYVSPYSSPFYLRDSYLSPIKRTYLWDHHPIRPFRLPIYRTSGGYLRWPLSDILDLSRWLPVSHLSHDPWWRYYLSLKPYNAPYISPYSSPFYLRDSYLSPIKRTYLWEHHPIRPLTTISRLRI